jgi:uncharacterized membrane protein YgaE (UPF0421/DUF939 family)
VQGTAAAAVAWAIARYVLDHEEPFFAPVAAVIALNTTVGERGLHAMRLMQGVIVGIIVGELTLAVLGGAPLSLALATFVAMTIAVALGGARITVAQAAVGAILTVAIGDAEAGAQRFIDAVVGAGVALTFSQLLFSPEPVRLLRGAESAALADMGRGLELAADALERDDDALAEDALRTLRDLRDRLVELARTRQASSRVSRRSAAWRSQRAPVVQETENAGYLDLLGSSCLMLTRAARAVEGDDRHELVRPIRELARALTALAGAPGDRVTRDATVERVLAVVRETAASGPPTDPALAAVMGIRWVAGDALMFAGVEPQQAVDAVEQGTGEFDVPTPAPAPRVPFVSRLRRPTK